MIKRFAILFLLASTSINAQEKKDDYFLESYAINLHPLSVMKGYLPLTVELRLKKRFSIETGPALVTRPYFYFYADIKPQVNTTVDGSFISFVSGEPSYKYQLGWETNIKFYLDRDIWESKYISIFHSYRNTEADLVSITDGRDDIEGYAFYRRNHFGLKYGGRYFINEIIGSAEDSWVYDSYFGFSYSFVESENFFNVPSNDNFDGIVSATWFLHFGISVGILRE
jgi:hypothetical protein